MPFFQFAGAFCTSDTSSRIFTAAGRQLLFFSSPSDQACVPNTNSQQESPRRQSLEHAIHRPTPIGASTEGREDEEQEGRGHQAPFATIVVARPAKEELTHDCAGKGNSGDIFLGRIAGVCFSVKSLEDGIDLADDTEVEIR